VVVRENGHLHPLCLIIIIIIIIIIMPWQAKSANANPMITND
jgi:hypothetical protein